MDHSFILKIIIHVTKYIRTLKKKQDTIISLVRAKINELRVKENTENLN